MDLPNRQSIRLKNYDYSQAGLYFITICTQNRICTLSDVRRGGALLRPQGTINQNALLSLPERYPNIEILDYVIMPNHIHFVIWIKERAEERAEQSPAPTVGDIVCAFKSITTKILNQYDHSPGRKFWQRNYYEHVIRDEKDYLRIREYIKNNPLNWVHDSLYGGE